MEKLHTLHFFRGAAKKQLQLGISFQVVYRAHYGIQTRSILGTKPDVKFIPVASGGVLQVSVVKGIDKLRESRMR
jgi:hypothetical protein